VGRSQLGRFTSADTVTPQLENPIAWDRYAYVNNSPINASDPTGHYACWDDNADDPGCSQNNPVTKSTPVPKYRFDTKYITEVIPFTPDELRKAATQIDHFALGVDGLAEAIVLGHVGIGTAGGLTFEGNPVTGAIGAGAGWILGETNPVVQGLVTTGNVAATVASTSSILADVKSGDSRLQFQVSQSETQLTLKGNASVSSNSLASGYLTTLGWATRIVEGSLIVQGTAVAFDHGLVPTYIFSTPFNIQFPRW